MILCPIVYAFVGVAFYQIGRAALIGNESTKSDKIINVTTSTLVAIAWPILVILSVIKVCLPSVKVDKDKSNIQIAWVVPPGGSGGDGRSGNYGAGGTDGSDRSSNRPKFNGDGVITYRDAKITVCGSADCGSADDVPNAPDDRAGSKL